MNTKRFYILSIIMLIATTAFIIIRKNIKDKDSAQNMMPLLPRKGSSAKSVEWKQVSETAQKLLDSIASNPDNISANTKLASLYIQEARETGNKMYYDKAAMLCVNNVLRTDSLNFTALVFKSLIHLSQHHFSDGLATAIKAQKVNPYNAYIYGLMVDSYVELGMYDSAVANADRMVNIRPDLTSYSRISYLREIYGSYDAAIEAMKLAVDAGGRGDENTEWARCQLGALYEKKGDYKTAESLYSMSLALRNDYPYAIAGMARVAVANNDINSAITLYEKADTLIEDTGIKEELVDLYRARGDAKKADELAETVVELLSKDATAANSDESIGHYADKELAYAYLKLKNYDKALEHAMLEYNRRPDNIDVNEAVAWVLYNRGEYAKALPYLNVALKTNSKNPVLLSRAALIYFRNGNKAEAKKLYDQSLASKSNTGLSLKSETAAIMQTL